MTYRSLEYIEPPFGSLRSLSPSAGQAREDAESVALQFLFIRLALSWTSEKTLSLHGSFAFYAKLFVDASVPGVGGNPGRDDKREGGAPSEEGLGGNENRRSLGFAPPDFLWELMALSHFMRLSLTERRTRGVVQRSVAGNPGRDDKIQGGVSSCR
jgi:hypothetical protein